MKIRKLDGSQYFPTPPSGETEVEVELVHPYTNFKTPDGLDWSMIEGRDFAYVDKPVQVDFEGQVILLRAEVSSLREVVGFTGADGNLRAEVEASKQRLAKLEAGGAMSVEQLDELAVMKASISNLQEQVKKLVETPVGVPSTDPAVIKASLESKTSVSTMMAAALDMKAANLATLLGDLKGKVTIEPPPVETLSNDFEVKKVTDPARYQTLLGLFGGLVPFPEDPMVTQSGSEAFVRAIVRYLDTASVQGTLNYGQAEFLTDLFALMQNMPRPGGWRGVRP